MSSLTVENGFQTFYDNQGNPLNYGFVYVGAVNLDPVTNPINVYWDFAQTIPAQQPIRTINGIPVRNGSPSNFYANSDYSITVKDSKNSFIYYSPNSNSMWANLASSDPDKGAALVANAVKSEDAITDVNTTGLPDGTVIVAKGRNTAGDGGGGVFRYSASSAQTADGGTVFTPFSGPGRLFRDGWTVFGFNGEVFVEWFGAKGDGSTDDTTSAQNAITSSKSIKFSGGKTYVIDTLSISSGKEIIIDGKCLRKPNAASDSYMFINSDGASGNSEIKIRGMGELDGNASNQSNDRQGLIRFQSPTMCFIDINRAGNNKYSTTEPVSAGNGCIVFTGTPIRSHVSIANLVNWQREGIYIDGASIGCSISNVKAIGDGNNSWTATSISGAGAIGNLIHSVYADNCGASSVVMDSTYSQCINIVSKNNQFGNGVNFGHTGKPASFSQAANITVINAGQGASSGTTHNGISIVGGTTDFQLTGVTVNGSYNNCINISDSASKVTISGANKLNGSLNGSGVHAFGADDVIVSGISASGNNQYGINFNAGNNCHASDCDLRGNTIGPFSGTGSAVTTRGCRLSNDALVGSINIAGFSSGGSITITNGNVAAFSTSVNIFPRNTTAAAAIPFISNKTSTGFTLTVVNAVSSGGGPHNVSYEIV